jgi:diphthine-ammonia ligase
VIHSDSAFATVAFLRIKSAVLESKPVAGGPVFHIPEVLDEKFAAVRDQMIQLHSKNPPPIKPPSSHSSSLPTFDTCSKQLDPWIAISNVSSILVGKPDSSIEDEVRQCFANLRSLLPRAPELGA